MTWADQQQRIRDEREAGTAWPDGWYINRTFSLADMEKITSMAKEGFRACDIAEELGVEVQAIVAACRRNHITIRN